MPRSPQFPYVIVAGKLRQRIERGEWQPGDQMPTVSDLCAQYEVSRATVERALAELDQEGLINRVPRWGTFLNG